MYHLTIPYIISGYGTVYEVIAMRSDTYSSIFVYN